MSRAAQMILAALALTDVAMSRGEGSLGFHARWWLRTRVCRRFWCLQRVGWDPCESRFSSRACSRGQERLARARRTVCAGCGWMGCIDEERRNFDRRLGNVESMYHCGR